MVRTVLDVVVVGRHPVGAVKVGATPHDHSILEEEELQSGQCSCHLT